jgi:hypothetical protein
MPGAMRCSEPGRIGVDFAAEVAGLPKDFDVLFFGGVKEGVAYAAPEAFDAKGDTTAAVIFVNEVDGERFREIDQIGGGR